jgi:hypothetical protein
MCAGHHNLYTGTNCAPNPIVFTVSSKHPALQLILQYFRFTMPLNCVQTGSGAHPASYTMGTGGSFPRGKAWLGRDADHSLSSNAQVKKE